MRRFTQLYVELDESNATTAKLAALKRYFREAPAADAAWALWFLMGRRLRSIVRSRDLRQWVGSATDFPAWLVDACYERVGDAAEVVSLLLPANSGDGTASSLCTIVTEHVQALGDWDPPVQFQLLREQWLLLNRSQAFVFHKLLTGNFRVGVSRSLVTRALAEVAGVEREVMAHRLMGNWQPAPSFFEQILRGEMEDEGTSRPYPFFLASPLDRGANLGEPDAWQVEWKWDGIRAQLIKRRGEIHLWSRGDESLVEQFPEIVQAAAYLPDGTVLDGEILIWSEGDDSPSGFEVLQTRIGRKRLSARILAEAPAVFQAYDLLEATGVDLRKDLLVERRAKLEAVVVPLRQPALKVSPVVEAADWTAYETLWHTARDRGVEGFILKRRNSPYRAGRVRGDWWKWKVDPLTADLVLLYAQAGHGRRASLFTDYTLGAWDGDRLVTVAKAFTGLTMDEIEEIDKWVKTHTLAKRGPIRTVPPTLVFEIAFDAVRESRRHKSGLALRFPRISRWRQDKRTEEADSVETLRRLLP